MHSTINIRGTTSQRVSTRPPNGCSFVSGSSQSIRSVRSVCREGKWCGRLLWITSAPSSRAVNLSHHPTCSRCAGVATRASQPRRAAGGGRHPARADLRRGGGIKSPGLPPHTAGPHSRAKNRIFKNQRGNQPLGDTPLKWERAKQPAF